MSFSAGFDPQAVVSQGLYSAQQGRLQNAQSALEKMTGGQTLEITATDDGVADDFPMFCKSRKLKLLKLEKRDGVYTILIQKPCEAR